MVIALRLSPLVIILAIAIFVITVRKGFSSARRYAIGLSLSFIAISVLIAAVALFNASDEADWPYVLVIITTVASCIGSGLGLALGYYYDRYIKIQ